MLWYFGNTTVRSPLRLRDGLIAISTSPLEGNLRGKENELKFCELLGNSGIVSLQGDVSNSVGRKWRSALEKLGFLYPKLPNTLSDLQDEIGAIDSITENGKRLIKAETVAGWQECFLRSLAAYYIPSTLEDRYNCEPFSPLRHVLRIMLELEKNSGENKINFIEMAVIVQCTSSEVDVKKIATDILNLREERIVSSYKRKFDQNKLDEASELHGIAPGTFKDYADTNFRYLKATGLVHNKGKGISLVPGKIVFIKNLVKGEKLPEDKLSYLKLLFSGAELPTDNAISAKAVLNDLIKQLKNRGEQYDTTGKKLNSPADIGIVRHEIEGRLLELIEIEYADNQKHQVNEISEFIDLLITRKRSKTLENGSTIEIPPSEAPAYFEWVIWRSFLAINSLVNQPWESRRFKIDQDFLPVGTAPGGGPDIIFEFDDMVLVVEVTLTTSSRQEAAEGEPVRRHVAHYAEIFSGSGKQVYGLFLAVTIDTNTANTFRLGEWYLKDDRKIHLDIVPITLVDFKEILNSAQSNISSVLPELKRLLSSCRSQSNLEAPEWKIEISNLSNAIAEKMATYNSEV